MRLQVFLSHNGVCSRREAMDIIQSGRVKVNGRLVKEPSTNVEGTEDITVDGQKIVAKHYSYVLLHKPAEYTTTKDDPYAKKIVMGLLPSHLRHLSPVGRLDRDTEGLLLFTNDGAWAQKLTHPKFHLEKTYQARVTGKLKPEDKKRLESGIMLPVEDEKTPPVTPVTGAACICKKTVPCRITDVRYNGSDTDLTITIHEGRKRQIRTMFYTIGHKVTYLKRVAIGGLTLGDLKLGQWRELSLEEQRGVCRTKPI